MIAGAAQLAMAMTPAIAQDTGLPPEEAVSPAAGDLFELPLEELLTLESTSVAKKRQEVSESAAAVHVITQDDIRRSPASTIPEILRMAPGVEVAQLADGSTAVTIRGFNSRAANNLLVMVDGRSIYVSTFSGVFWDQLMLPLGDIERIEVIRGPGASLWGANAVNGVVNIITKHSADTLGVNAVARASSRKQEASLSFGARASDNLSYRLYASYRRDRGLVDAQGDNLTGFEDAGSAGLRVDWEPNTQDAFSLSAEYSDGSFESPYLKVSEDLFNPGYVPTIINSDTGGSSIVARWVHRHSDDLDWSVQATYEEIARDELGQNRMKWAQADLDLGLHWKINEVHDLNFGIGARIMQDSVSPSPSLWLDPEENTDRWVSGYVQDDISIVPEKLRLTIGAKLENNTFTGWEFQPNIRLFWRALPELALWGGISRAVRTPSRFERAARASLTVDLPGTPTNPSPLPIYATLVGSEDRRSSRLNAYELGLRADLAADWSIELAGYYNRHDRLTAPALTSTSLLFAPPFAAPVGLIAEVGLASDTKATTWGGEAALKGQVTPWWKLRLNWSHFNYSVALDPATGQESALLAPLDASPRNQFALYSGFDISEALQVNASLRHVGQLKGGTVPAYTEADFRVTFQPMAAMDLSLIGENLLSAQHLEFIEPGYPAPPSYVARSVSAEIRFRF